MRYIDTGIRTADQTVANWFEQIVAAGVTEFRCQVGYFTLEGCGLLVPTLKRCASEGTPLRLLLGSNSGATLASDVAFLAGALDISRNNVSMGVVTFAGSLFHPKVYHFVRPDRSQAAYVGSANFTGPGTSGLNIEAGIILDTNDGDDEALLREIARQIERWFDEGLPGLFPVNSHTDIHRLLAEHILATAPTRSSAEPGEEPRGSDTRSNATKASLRPLVRLPKTDAQEAQEGAASGTTDDEGEPPRNYRHTEQGYHYPQGVHLGHLLSILMHFSGDRVGTGFDDRFIRLSGSLGSGRLALYRRQVKYKLSAATELNLITDIRLQDKTDKFVPELTQTGVRLWELFEPHIDRNDLIISAQDDLYSSRMPKQAPFYNQIIARAREQNEELNDLYLAIMLNMPAVEQMLKLLYWEQIGVEIAKAWIYTNYFDSAAVQAFCDLVGIEPATEDGAKHRCPFLLNVLESCGVISQTSSNVTIQALALSPNMLRLAGDTGDASVQRLQRITAGWASKTWSLDEGEVSQLRELFGDQFLTANYRIQRLIEAPPHVEPISS